MAAATGVADRYTIISADCHAGGSHETYREYLDPDVPRGLRRLARQVQEPVQGPARHRPRCATGTTSCATPSRRPTASSARSCSRTPCRRSSRASCCSPGRPSPRTTSTASPASARTTAGSSTCATSSRDRRAGIGQIFLNDVDDAIDDVTWIKEHGLRGGVLLPNIPPDVKWVKPLYDPELRPAVGGVPGPRDPGQRARRHRLARLRPVPACRCCSTSPRSASTPSARSCT